MTSPYHVATALLPSKKGVDYIYVVFSRALIKHLFISEGGYFLGGGACWRAMMIACVPSGIGLC